MPDSGPTVASRTCMVVGGLLKACAEELKERLGGLSPSAYLKRHGPLRVTRQYEPPPGIVWDDATYRGDAYATYGWGCDVVEVELDPVTYEVRPTRVTAVVEIGRAINPLMVAGQVEGGTAQGLGYALLEEVVMREGRMANAQLTNYLDPDDARHAADRRDDPREPLPARALRGQGSGRDADERAGAGGGQRGAPPRPRRPLAPDHAGEGPRMRFVLNGKRADVDAPPLKRLLDVLREDCGLTGTKEGCGEGECGACTVLVDGVPVNSCLVPLAHVRGRKVTTIEGLRSRVPEALVREGGTQCGICTPGVVMAAAALGPTPTAARVREALAGNLCRCTGYAGHRAGARRRPRGAPPAGPGCDRERRRRRGQWPPPSRPALASPAPVARRGPAPAARRGPARARSPGAPISTSASTSAPSASRASSTSRACGLSAASASAATRS